MSGVSELGNLTNVRLFCQLLQKRKIIPQLRSYCSSSPQSFRRTRCCPLCHPGRRLRPHSTFEQNSNRMEFKNFKRYFHASAFGHLGTKHLSMNMLFSATKTPWRKISCVTNFTLPTREGLTEKNVIAWLRDFWLIVSFWGVSWRLLRKHRQVHMSASDVFEGTPSFVSNI